MTRKESKHFAIAPVGLGELSRSDDHWIISATSLSGAVLPQEPITRIAGYHPVLRVVVEVDQHEGPRITEGVYDGDLPEGRMGASIFGTSDVGRMGYSFIDQASSYGQVDGVLFAGSEQKRRTLDVDGDVFNIPRGFADQPELTNKQLACLEHKQEVGGGVTSNWVSELGQAQVTNPDLMSTSLPGQGINIFRFDLPKRLIEELPHMSDHERRRWRVSSEFQQAEGSHKALEGISRSIFVQLMEVVRQDMWSGPVDLMTYVASARLMQSRCRLDFRNAWERLKDRQVSVQTRDRYPISPLDQANFEKLIGRRPGWQWRINSQDRPTPLSSFSAFQPATGHELAMGERGEATNFDGSVVAMPRAVVMPMVEIGGKIYVGGRFANIPRVGEVDPFVATSVPIRLDEFSASDLIPQIESDTGITGIFTKGVFQPHVKQTVTFNPNSAHETEAQLGFTLQVNPGSLIRAARDRYHILGGDPNYCFVPLSMALDSPIGPTAVVAASLYMGANILSVRRK